MPRKVFIDVGGHYGETLEPALDPIFGFDIIYTFEPVKECCDVIRKIKDQRLRIIRAGLSNETSSKKIFNPGHVGASIFPDIEIPDKNNSNFEICDFIEASSFFKENIWQDDELYIKLNCEGSECDVIENLVLSGEYSKVKACLIDFDVRKVPSQRHRRQDILRLLSERGISNYYSSEEVLYGPSNYVAIRRWLHTVGAASYEPIAFSKSILHHLSHLIAGKNSAYYKWQIVKFLPKSVMNFYYQKLKSQ